MKRLKKEGRWAYIAMFAGLFVLGLLFPYTGDDWAWGSQIGLDRLASWFENYSGRYVGNLIVLALTRSAFLRAAAVSLCIGGSAWLLQRISGSRKYGLSLVLLALVLMPASLLRQSVAWTAGFANYATSICLVLVYIAYINPMYRQAPGQKPWQGLLLLALGFASALIVEHVTLYCLALGLYVLVYTAARYKRVCWQHIGYLLGAIAGTVLIGPLCLITPIGSRCFFASYLMMVLFALELFALVKEPTPERVKGFVWAAVCVGFVGLFGVYATVHVAHQTRVDKAIRDGAASREITVERLPYESYVWCSGLDGELWQERFKLFYGIDSQVQITPVAYEGQPTPADRLVEKLRWK